VSSGPFGGISGSVKYLFATSHPTSPIISRKSCFLLQHPCLNEGMKEGTEVIVHKSLKIEEMEPKFLQTLLM
jgi:hypothetical protein